MLLKELDKELQKYINQIQEWMNSDLNQNNYKLEL